ncbi:YlbE family protein [Rubrobacter aplysinae]|uniref:DUF1116 domain-containing protein n=1 Tax=Rubrobacter aplysinae TaxID=909625 RepID=UPI00064C211D|nr:DUF1116 domain-containing protein [Rubrobacter aplysinae]
MTEISELNGLLGSRLSVANVGVPFFAEELATQGVEVSPVDWAPPLGGDAGLGWALARMLDGGSELGRRVEEANEQALQRLLAADPVWVDVRPAGEVVPGVTQRTLLHAGPPVAWSEMAGPMRGAVIGALIYEGLAQDPEQAVDLCERDEVELVSGHSVGAIGPMAGVISASMPVIVVEDRASGGRAFSNLNEGLGSVLRFGSYSEEVLNRLEWMRGVLGPALSEAVRSLDGIGLKNVTAQALQMGDECHNRNTAATSLLFRRLAPQLSASSMEGARISEVFDFLAGNDHFYLNFSMAAAKVGLDAASGVPGSTMVTAMSRNGVEFGLKVSGTGDRWYTAPAERIDGLFFPGYSADDAALDIGDSSITETSGIGGFAMAAAPAIVQFVGGTAETALAYTRRMYEVTLAKNPSFAIPSLFFAGAPTGIDVRLVADSGTLPIINTGIAHREPGIGQIGAGVVSPPAECFEKAIAALARELELV